MIVLSNVLVLLRYALYCAKFSVVPFRLSLYSSVLVLLEFKIPLVIQGLVLNFFSFFDASFIGACLFNVQTNTSIKLLNWSLTS